MRPIDDCILGHRSEDSIFSLDLGRGFRRAYGTQRLPEPTRH